MTHVDTTSLCTCAFTSIYACTYIHVYGLGRSTKTHLYWCMKNCAGNHADLKERILNISHHYQVLLLYYKMYMYCVGLPCVCLTLLASFFVPSHLSLKTCTCTCTLICWSCGYVSHDLYCVCEPLGQGNHAGCHQSSPCKRPGYSPSKNTLKEKAAIEAYEKALQQTQVYRYAESYCRVLPHVCTFAHTCILYMYQTHVYSFPYQYIDVCVHYVPV